MKGLGEVPDNEQKAIIEVGSLSPYSCHTHAKLQGRAVNDLIQEFLF